MLSGEEEGEMVEGRRPHDLASNATAKERNDEEAEELEDVDNNADGQGALLGSLRALLAESDEDDDEDDDALAPSAHERRQLRMQQKIK